MHTIFEQSVRRRTLLSVGPVVQMAGGFNTVADLQQFACGRAAEPEQVKGLALYFHVPIPPNYGAQPAKTEAA